MNYPELVSIAAAARALGVSQVQPLALEAAGVGACYRVGSTRPDAPGPADDATTYPGWSSVFVTVSWVATKLVAIGKFAEAADALAAARLANAETQTPAPVVVPNVFAIMTPATAADLADLVG